MKLSFLARKRKIFIVFISLVLAVVTVLLYIARQEDSEPASQKNINIALGNGKYDQAINLIKKAINESPSNNKKSDLYVELGNTYIEAKKPKEAIDSYNKAAELTTTTHIISRLIAEAYLVEGDKTKAIKYFEKSAKLWPKDDPLYDAEINSLRATIQNLQGKQQ